MDKTDLFVTVVLFWFVLLIILGQVGETVITEQRIKSQINDDSLYSVDESILGNVKFSDKLTFIFQIMTWTVPKTLDIPLWLSAFMDTYLIFTIYLLVLIIRGN